MCFIPANYTALEWRERRRNWALCREAGKVGKAAPGRRAAPIGTELRQPRGLVERDRQPGFISIEPEQLEAGRPLDLSLEA